MSNAPVPPRGLINVSDHMEVGPHHTVRVVVELRLLDADQYLEPDRQHEPVLTAVEWLCERLLASESATVVQLLDELASASAATGTPHDTFCHAVQKWLIEDTLAQEAELDRDPGDEDDDADEDEEA